MKIKIDLEYNDEQIQYFAEQKGRTNEDLEVFIVSFLKNYLIELVSAPFIDKVRMERM